MGYKISRQSTKSKRKRKVEMSSYYTDSNSNSNSDSASDQTPSDQVRENICNDIDNTCFKCGGEGHSSRLCLIGGLIPYCDFKEKLGKKLFLDKESMDVKIICGDRTFQCHKIILTCQCEVFKRMFSNENSEMIENKSGEVKIEDITAETMEKFLYFLYHDRLEGINLVDTKLLQAAHKYQFDGLFTYCSNVLKKNLTLENSGDGLYFADLLDQKALFDAASEFVCENRRELDKSKKWKKYLQRNPEVVANVLSKML